ncbi:MAG: hypothetical protein NUV76_09555 [Candidatus Kuenenia sp.]|nr:hypothetical protein [Candidatus Kuenenia sp.]
MTNKFQIPNMDLVIWALEFYHSTLPHYTHKLMGSGYKPEPAGSIIIRSLNKGRDALHASGNCRT